MDTEHRGGKPWSLACAPDPKPDTGNGHNPAGSMEARRDPFTADVRERRVPGSGGLHDKIIRHGREDQREQLFHKPKPSDTGAGGGCPSGKDMEKETTCTERLVSGSGKLLGRDQSGYRISGEKIHAAEASRG